MLKGSEELGDVFYLRASEAYMLSRARTDTRYSISHWEVWKRQLFLNDPYAILVTNSLELSPSLEVASCEITQELPSISLNLKVHYRLHKRTPLVPILSQTNPVHTTPIYESEINLNIIHTRLCVPSNLLCSGFTTNSSYSFLFPHSFYIPCQSHPRFDTRCWSSFSLNFVGVSGFLYPK
jgi:hypothetical protein